MNQDSTHQYQQFLSTTRYFKKKTNYVPIPDGFVTSAGNPDLAAKYGNNLGINTITNQQIIEATKKNSLKV